MNTMKKGQVRCMVFEEAGTWYGVALEFNIVVDGDDAEVVQFNLNEAVKGYVESQRKMKGSRLAPLNQKPDEEYARLWRLLESGKPVPSPISVQYYGFATV